MTQIRLSFIALLLLALSGCSANVVTNGKYLSDAQMASITQGMSQDAILAEVGSPSYISPLSENLWAYIGTKSRVRLFQNPQPFERRILAIQFVGTTARELVYIELKDGRTIYPNPERTPTNGRTISVIEDLIGNIGRF